MFVVIIAALLLGLAGESAGNLIEVPNDYASISLALDSSLLNDTVWVHPGTYEERLIFPAHDVVLISDYFMGGDSSAIDSTIIDASPFADLDTASVLTFVHGNSRATFVGGFTFTGGHGTNFSGGSKIGGCILMDSSSPVIHSCKITRNELGEISDGFVIYSSGGSPAVTGCEIFDNCGPFLPLRFQLGAAGIPVVFERNDVHDNYSCNGPLPYVVSNGITAVWDSIIVRFNYFHDYEGLGNLGLFLEQCHGAVYGNTFERLSTPEQAHIITVTDNAIAFRDNTFRDCSLENGSCIGLAHSGNLNPFRTLVERNWFENIVNFVGPSCLYMQLPNAEVRENVFLNCRGWVGAVQLSQQPPVGCNVVFDRNHFFYNQAVGGQPVTGSAFTTLGWGPPCSFVNNWFEGNEGWTVHFMLADSLPIDMSGNYWGDPSGPFHPTENPGGLGDSVPVNVQVTPWLTEPPGMSAALETRLSLGPEDWTLEGAYPNPFNAITSLRIISAKPQPFAVIAYSTLGQRVAAVWEGIVPRETPVTVHWDGNGERGHVASGIYYLLAVPRGPGARAPKCAKVVLLR